MLNKKTVYCDIIDATSFPLRSGNPSVIFMLQAILNAGLPGIKIADKYAGR
jgi:hypothetical protein